MIDKDQFPAIRLMIREIYQPVMMRALANLVLVDISQIAFGFPGKTVEHILSTEKCQKALIDSLEQHHRPRKYDLIDEILKAYGLFPLKDEQELYHRYMGAIFDTQADFIKKLLKGFKYKQLYSLSQIPTQ